MVISLLASIHSYKHTHFKHIGILPKGFSMHLFIHLVNKVFLHMCYMPITINIMILKILRP